MALFTVDFAELVQPQNPVRHKVYRISPLKCRDLAALLEFEIVWDYAKPPPQSMQLPPSMPSMSSMPSSSLPQSSGMMGIHNMNQNNSVSIAGMPSSSLLSTMKQRQNGYPETSSSISSRRTTASMSSQNSDRDPLADLAGCSDCRSSKRRLERKEMQILQLETFLKESQKRIDSLIFENEELIIREQAETKNAGQYRAMTIRLLQELEMAFQFCATQVMQAQDSGADMSTSFMFLPQFEFMERVKRFHFELDALAGMNEDGDTNPAGFKNAQDAWKLFDFRSEMDTALERNQRLQRQLEFLSHSLVYDVQDSTAPPPPSYQNNTGAAFNKVGGFSHGMPQLRRTNTQTSADTSGGDSDNSLDDSLAMSRAAPVFTMTEQINNLERENFVLKSKLESALLDVQQYQKVNPHSETYDTTSSSSHGTNTMHDDDSLQVELEEVREVKSLLEQEKNMLQQDKSVLEHELTGARAEIEKLLRQLDQNASSLANSQSSVSAMAPPPYPFDSQQQHSSFDASAPGSERGSTAAPGFLNKIYMDVGKAKIALEEKVKQLNVLLREATDDNLRLQAQLEAQQELLMKQQQDLEINSEYNGPKIVELDDDSNEVNKVKIAELERQIQQFHRQLDESHKKLAVKEQELAALSASIAGRELATAAIGTAKKDTEKELEVTLMMLMKAQDQTTELEGQVKMLQQQLQAAEQRAKAAEATAAAAPITPPSVPSSPSLLISNGGDRGDEIMELAKQLKLSKQEVMQLRYRSNQMESVNEKLEEALKEKRTLQVKLTALEGQLYDHRSRTISDNSFASDQNVMVAELQKQLDQRSAQLLISQREFEMLRREIATRPAPATSTADTSYSISASTAASNNADVEELSAKVKKFETEISRLCDRNDDQARKIDELGDRITQVTQERIELEGICMQMVQEMDLMAHLNGNVGNSTAENDNDNDSDEYEVEELEEKAPAPASFAPISVAVPAMVTTTKVTDRYASALASNDRPPSNSRDATNTPATSGAAGTQSKVAHLIKNFTDSNETSSSSFGSNGRRPSDPASNVKKVTKIDFRLRNASNASARSASTSTGSAVEAMAARFQAGIGSSSSRD